MPSIFGHLATGYAIGKLPFFNGSKWLLVIATLSAFLPDLDVISFNLGIPYEHALGHRGFTHSIAFAIGWAILMAAVFRKTPITAFLMVFLCTVSHGIFDAMTTGGLGVAFFWPFDHDRYFLPWRPIQVSPIGVKNFMSEKGVKVVLSELVWLILPSLLVVVISKRLK